MEVGNCTRWSELHTDFLESIFNRVGVIEYLMCACVCKSWRSAANSFKQKFMASQSPLVCLMPVRATTYCYFYNIFDQRLYRAALSHLEGNICLGFTCGYLVLSRPTGNRGNIWLVNPFTRHELEFPRPPGVYSHVTLASLANSDQEFVVVAFSRFRPYFHFRRSGDVNWTYVGYAESIWQWTIIDFLAFKGKIYALNTTGRIHTLNLADGTLEYLYVSTICKPQYNPHLVASHEELYIADFYAGGNIFEIHKLDFEGNRWEEVELQGEMLFLSDPKSYGISLPIPSMDCGPGRMNQILYLGYNPLEDITGHHTALYVSTWLRMEVSVIPEDWQPPNIFFHSPLWYFPHLSISVDSVSED